MNHINVLYEFCIHPIAPSAINTLETYRKRHRLQHPFFREGLPNGDIPINTCLLSVILNETYDSEPVQYLLDHGARFRFGYRGRSPLDIVWDSPITPSRKLEWYELFARYGDNPFDSVTFFQVLFHYDKEERDLIWKCVMKHTNTWLELGVMIEIVNWQSKNILLIYHTDGVLPNPSPSDIWIDRFDEEILLYILSVSSVTLVFSRTLIEHLLYVVQQCETTIPIHDPGIRKNILTYFFSNVMEQENNEIADYIRLPVQVDSVYQTEVYEDFYHHANTRTWEEIEEHYTEIRKKNYAWWVYKYKLFQWLIRNQMDRYFHEEDYLSMLFEVRWYPHPLDKEMRTEFGVMVRTLLHSCSLTLPTIELLLLTNDLTIVKEIPWTSSLISHAKQVVSTRFPFDRQKRKDECPWEEELVQWVNGL